MTRPISMSLISGIVCAAGCGPAPPKLVLERPPGFSTSWHGKPLFHTPNAYIYAKDEMAAGEADRVVRDVAADVQRRYRSTLGKGVVILLEPEDRSIAGSIEELYQLDRDPSLNPIAPKKEKSIAELRREMAENGLPEGPMVASSSCPLPQAKLSELGLIAPGSAWALVAPSYARARACSVKLLAGGFRKKSPSLSQEAAEKHASMFAGLSASEFCKNRGYVIFMLWVQSQKDWTEQQKRDAIRRTLPKTPDTEW